MEILDAFIIFINDIFSINIINDISLIEILIYSLFVVAVIRIINSSIKGDDD